MEQRAGNESSRGGKAVQECERGITWGQMKDEKVIKYMRTEEIGDWVHCPKCGSKTRTKIQVDTTAKNLPVFCPKCKKTFLAEVHKGLKTIFKSK